MKWILIGAALAVSPANADQCSDIAEMAAIIADMRDAGVPLSRALDSLGQLDISKSTRGLVQTLTVQGYSSGVSAADFYIIVDAACRKAQGEQL